MQAQGPGTAAQSSSVLGKVKRLTDGGSVSRVDHQRGLAPTREGAQHGVPGQVHCRRPAMEQQALRSGLSESCCCDWDGRWCQHALGPQTVHKAASCGAWLQGHSAQSSSASLQQNQLALQLDITVQHIACSRGPAQLGGSCCQAGTWRLPPVALKQGLHCALAHGRRLVGGLRQQQRVLGDVCAQPVPAHAGSQSARLRARAAALCMQCRKVRCLHEQPAAQVCRHRRSRMLRYGSAHLKTWSHSPSMMSQSSYRPSTSACDTCSTSDLQQAALSAS